LRAYGNGYGRLLASRVFPADKARILVFLRVFLHVPVVAYNQQRAVISQKISTHNYMLYAYGTYYFPHNYEEG
jgi:hypothetical protein